MVLHITVQLACLMSLPEADNFDNLSRNNFGQVVHTHVPLSLSSIIDYPLRPKGGDALRLRR